METHKVVIKTSKAPTPVAPYSQGVVLGNVLYCSGQIGLVPETGKLVSESVEDQARQVLKNLSAVLQEAGCSLKDVVKVTVFLTDMKDFAIVNEVYASFFTAPFPARTAVQVSALPVGGQVEMEAIAHYH